MANTLWPGLLLLVTVLVHVLHSDASYGSPHGSSPIQLLMMTGKPSEKEILLVPKPCSGIPMVYKSGHGHTKNIVMMQNKCKKAPMMIMPMIMPEYGGHSYGGGGEYGGGGGGYGGGHGGGGYGGGGGKMSYDQPMY